MSDGQHTTIGIHALPVCGCGCTIGDCYHNGCHCQFYEESLSTRKISKNKPTNNRITKKTENNKKKED